MVHMLTGEIYVTRNDMTLDQFTALMHRLAEEVTGDLGDTYWCYNEEGDEIDCDCEEEAGIDNGETEEVAGDPYDGEEENAS